jgi:hypothetical protein
MLSDDRFHFVRGEGSVVDYDDLEPLAYGLWAESAARQRWSAAGRSRVGTTAEIRGLPG